MALSGSTTVNATSHNQIIFSWSATQNASANSSTVSWTLKMKSDKSGYISSSASKNWSVTVNGTKYSGTNTVGIAANSTKTLASGSTVIAHNSDGTKTFSYSFSQYLGIKFSGSTVNTVTGSGSGVLNAIAQASTLLIDGGTIGVAQNLTINRFNSSYTHTITWTAGGQNGTVCTKSTATSISFTPPNDMAYGNTSGTNTIATFYIETFNGDTSVGKRTYSVTIAIPDSITPKISVSITDTSSAYNTYGSYVQGLTRLRVTITGTGVYGSTITGYYHTINGVDYSGSVANTGVINNSGTINVISTVYDSRGRRKSTAQSLTVASYSSPTISLLAAHRCDKSGAEDMQGAYVCVSYSHTICSLNSKNSKTLVLEYKKTTSTTYTSISLPSVYTSSNATQIFPADDDAAYDIRLTVADSHSQTIQYTRVSPAFCLWHIHNSGRGITFGSIATGEGFNVNMDAHFGNGITQDVKMVRNTSCKDITKTGTYFLDTTCTEMPVNASGWLVVKAYGTPSYVTQEFYRAGSKHKYLRIYSGSSWNGWVLETPKDTVTTIKEGSLWTYREWSSGTVECWCNKVYTDIAVSTALTTNIYISDYIGGDTFPVTFSEVPSVTYSNHTTNDTGAMLWAGRAPTTTTCASVRLIRTSSQYMASGFISFHAVGWV